MERFFNKLEDHPNPKIRRRYKQVKTNPLATFHRPIYRSVVAPPLLLKLVDAQAQANNSSLYCCRLHTSWNHFVFQIDIVCPLMDIFTGLSGIPFPRYLPTAVGAKETKHHRHGRRLLLNRVDLHSKIFDDFVKRDFVFPLQNHFRHWFQPMTFPKLQR